MAARLGENIQSEWDQEPFPGELWDGIEALKRERTTGIAMLTSLAKRGSVLGMMYLGHAFSTSGDTAEVEQAEMWLTLAAEGGSIEGRYQLAAHYERLNDGVAAAAQLRALAALGYGPAMYALGRMLYQGDLVDRNVSQAMEYLKMAKGVGHLPSIGFLSWVYRKESFGIAGNFVSHWLCLTKVPALAWYLMRYPNSDRLRGFKMLSAP
jgi:TPR repeat protein